LLKTKNILLNNHWVGLTHLCVQITNKVSALTTRNPQLAVQKE